MRIRITLFLAGALAGTNVHAAENKVPNGQVLTGPVPAWAIQSEPLQVPDNAAGAVFIRRQDTEVHLDGKGQSVYNGYRVRILHPNALQLGNLSLVWNPSGGAPIVHAIKIHRNGEVIDVMRNARFEVLRREDQLEQAMLDGNLTAVLRVPDLRVGDEIEFGATWRSGDPTLGKDGAGLLFLSPEPAPGRYLLRLSWDEGAKPKIKPTGDMAAVASEGGNAIDYRFDNPGLLVPPKDAPPRYNWQRIVEYSTFNDWRDISRLFFPMYVAASRLGTKSALRQETARIAAAHATPFERAAAALKIVQQDIRYIYVGLNGGNLTPANADTTWERRYGDCKAKTALLLAMLRELGVDAEAVLVNNSDSLDGLGERLPSPRMFDHVLVRAHVEGKVYWLDGTLPAVATPALDPIFPYQWILPLTESGSSLEQIPWKPASRPDAITLYEIDAREGFDKPARITSTSIKRGIEGIQQEMQFAAVTPGQLLEGFRQKAIGDTFQTIEDVTWRYDVKAQASILKIVGTGAVDWDNDGDGIRSLALPGGGFNPPDKRIRAMQQDQALPFYNEPEFDCFVTTVRLPLSTKPRQWSHKDDIDNRIFGRSYYRAFDIYDGSLRMIRGSRTELKEVEASRAIRDNARIAAFDNSMAWITFDPMGKNDRPEAGARVPATFDIDWTADRVPCLSRRTDP